MVCAEHLQGSALEVVSDIFHQLVIPWSFTSLFSLYNTDHYKVSLLFCQLDTLLNYDYNAFVEVQRQIIST